MTQPMTRQSFIQKSIMSVAVMAAVALAGIVGQGCSKQTTSDAAAQLEKLKGRWVRPDGGYVIEIGKIEADGKLAAAYFNPNPINVSKASAKQEGGQIKLFVELRDQNYPGCTYDLTYDSQNDTLVGVYFQAALQQRFDVVFARMR